MKHRNNIILLFKAYKKIGELEKAKCDFEKAVEYNPNFSMAHMQKWYANYQFASLNGNIYLVEITVRNIEKAIAKYSNSPECVCYYVLYAEVRIITYNFGRKKLKIKKIKITKIMIVIKHYYVVHILIYWWNFQSL